MPVTPAIAVDAAARRGHRGPLAGVRVLELAGLGPAQLGGMLLGDLGADIIRVDRPSALPNDVGASPGDALGRGRRSIVLDLKAVEGVELALELAASCDVLIDPYRPGVTERLGLGPDAASERNPRLIYARVTGWGQSGPLAQAAGHDINYIALAGALQPIGERTSPPPVPLNLIGDFGGGGMLLGFAVAAALVERARSGRGQVIDVAMVDGVASLMTSIFQLNAQGEWDPERGMNWLQGAAPWYRSYETGDGRYLSVGSLEPQFYDLLLRRLGFEPSEWPQWDRARWPALTDRFCKLFASRSLAHWTAELEGTDVCFAPALRLDEVTIHPHLVARGTYVERDGVTQPAPVPRFERTPGEMGTAAPRVGQHTVEVLSELGVPEDRRAAALRTGVAVQCTAEAGA